MKTRITWAGNANPRPGRRADSPFFQELYRWVFNTIFAPAIVTPLRVKRKTLLTYQEEFRV